MDRFYQFLQEMPTLLSTSTLGKNAKHTALTYLGRFQYKYDKTQKVSDHGDYEVHKHTNNGPSDNNVGDANATAYSLYHKPTKNYHMILQGRHVGDTFHISYLQGHPQSQVKAHDFYHHLITKHGMKLNSDADQSVGGMKVWHKLSKNPEVSVTHHDISGNQIPVQKKFSRNYSPEIEWGKAAPANRNYVHAYSTFRAKRLDEMPTMLSWLGKYKHQTHVSDNPMFGLVKRERLGDYNHDYEVHHDFHDPNEDYNGEPGHTYKLVHKPTGHTHVSVTGFHALSRTGPKETDLTPTFNVKYVEGTEASKVKAHDFYHHLIHKHSLILRSDVHQSEGGAHIWKNLAGKEDIQTTHHNVYGHPIHMDHYTWNNNYTKETKPENTLTFSHFIARKK